MHSSYSDQEFTRIKKWLSRHHIKPIPKEIIFPALTHPSFKGMYPDVQDYERLEFLGDAVLDLITADYLFTSTQEFQLTEGQLTERRKELVNNRFLAHIFTRLDMATVIYTASNYSLSLKDQANFVESLLGAVFLAEGYHYAQNLWNSLFKSSRNEEPNSLSTIPEKWSKTAVSLHEHSKELEPSDFSAFSEFIQIYEQLRLSPKNAKSILQELCQKQGLPLPNYTIFPPTGEDHQQCFTAEVSGVMFQHLPDRVFSAQGYGTRKNLAEIQAAQKLCDKIYLQYTS